MAFDTTLGIPYKIDLDIHNRKKFETMYAKQYDKEARYVEATLFNDNENFIIPTGTTCIFGCKKRSTKIVESPAIIQDNKIYYRLEEQVTAVDGDVEAEFTLSFNGVTLGCPKFKIFVEKGAVDATDIEDSDDVNILTSLITDANAAIVNTNTATTNANTAATNANNVATQLTNETLIIWKPYVATYSAIATTYPSPSIGWTTQCQDTGANWRYNGTTWINIGTSTNDKVGDLSTLTTDSKTNAVSAIIELDSVKAQYADLATLSGTSIHFTNAEDAVVQITKIDGATTVTPADPTKGISPDNVATIISAGDTAFDVVSCRKNLFDINTCENGLLSTTDGSLTYFNEWFTSQYIIVTGGKKIVLSIESASVNKIVRLVEYEDNKSFISGTYNPCGVNGNTQYALNLNEKTKCIRISFGTGSGITLNEYINAGHTIQIEYETQSSYEPYKSNNINISYPMPKLQSGFGNTIEPYTDTKDKYIERCRRYTLTSNEGFTWYANNATNQTITFVININPIGVVYSSVICNRFSNLSINAAGCLYFPSVNWAVFGITSSDTDTAALNKVLNWFGNNPTMIIYPLATPIETIIDKIYLISYQGITNVFTTANPQVTITAAAKSKLWNDTRKIGDLSKLTTSSNTDLVVGINEVNAKFTDIFNNSTYLTTIINKMQFGEAVKIVCYGDSVTYGDNGSGTQTSNPYPATLQSRLRLIYNNNNITVVNAGHNGQQSSAALANFDSEIVPLTPDLVIIMYGINDISGYVLPTVPIATYKTNITTMIKKCIINNFKTLLLTPTFTSTPNLSSSKILAYGQCVKEISNIYSIPCIDMHKEQEKMYLNGSKSVHTNMVDGAHFSDTGYQLIADTILQNALDINMSSALAIKNLEDIYVSAVNTKYIKTDGTFINTSDKQFNIKNYEFKKDGTYGSYLNFEFYINQKGMDLFLIAPQSSSGGTLTVVDNGSNLSNTINFYAEENKNYDVPILVYENIPLGYHRLEFKISNLVNGDMTAGTSNPFMYFSMFKFTKTEIEPDLLDKYWAYDLTNYSAIEKFRPVVYGGIRYNSSNTYNSITLRSGKPVRLKASKTLVVEFEGYIFDKCGVSWFSNISGNDNTSGHNEGYLLVFNTNDITIYQSGVNNDSKVFTNSASTVTLDYTKTHKIRIEHAYAGTIKVYVDGTLQITCTSKRYNAGYFGLNNLPAVGKSMQLSRFEYAYV